MDIDFFCKGRLNTLDCTSSLDETSRGVMTDDPANESGQVGSPTAHSLASLVGLVSQSLKRDTLAQDLIEWTARELAPDIACYYKRDYRSRTFIRVAGFPDRYWGVDANRRLFDQRPIDRHALGVVDRTKQVLIVSRNDESAEKAEWIPFSDAHTTEVLIPIVAQESLIELPQVLGVLALGWDTDRSHLKGMLSLAELVGKLVSESANNALAGERRERFVGFLKNVTALPAARSVAYQQFLESLFSVAPTRFVSAWLLDHHSDCMVLQAFFPGQIGKEKITPNSFDSIVFPREGCTSGRALANREPLIIKNVDRASGFRNPAFARTHGLNWFLSIPVRSLESQQMLGVINVWPDLEPEELDEAAVSTYAEYASHLATAARASQLAFKDSILQQFESRLNELVKFEDHRRSWDGIAQRVAREIGSEGCSVFLASGDRLVLKGTTGLVSNPDYASVTYLPGEGLTGRVFQREQPLVYHLEQVEMHRQQHISKYRESSSKARSIMFVPLMDGMRKAMGVIRCVNKSPSDDRTVTRFTSHDVANLEAVASLVSAGCERVRLIRAKEDSQDRAFKSLHHEIVGPVDQIVGDVDWIERHTTRTVPADWDVRKLRLKFDDLKQLSRLLRNIAMVMGPLLSETLTPERVRVKPIINLCLGLVRNERKRRTVDVAVDPTIDLLPRVTADRFALMAVLYNLVRNSLKYIDVAEPIKTLRFYADDRSEDDGVVDLFIEDNGIGIDEGDEERIFERFYRGEKAKTVAPLGEGLGLHFCREILEHMKSEIGLAASRKPTRFRVTLKVSELP